MFPTRRPVDCLFTAKCCFYNDMSTTAEKKSDMQNILKKKTIMISLEFPTKICNQNGPFPSSVVDLETRMVIRRHWRS